MIKKGCADITENILSETCNSLCSVDNFSEHTRAVFRELINHTDNILNKMCDNLKEHTLDVNLHDKLLDKIQSSTFEELDARANKAHEKETLKQNIDILNDHLLNGTRIQFNCSGEQWHNVTGKFKLEQLKHKSIKLRVRPDRVSIDGYMLTPKQAIDYINRNYDNE